MDEHRLQEELRRTRQELYLLYEIGNLIRTSLLLDEVVYLILCAVTSHEGLGFNRAILFMVDKTGTNLEGVMGIGPTHPAASPQVWRMIEENRITLEGLLDVYHKSGGRIDEELNKIVRQIRMPIEKSFGILPNTIIHDKPALVREPDIRHELCDMRLMELGITECAVVPLRGKDQVVGLLLVDNVTTRKPINEPDLRRVLMLAGHAGLALENAKTYTEAVIHSRQDSLTKLWNYGYFHQTLEGCIKESKNLNQMLSIIVFDIDDFKSYNDTYGHLAGDHAIQSIAEISTKLMRKNDILARYGGEEFGVILPGTQKAEARNLAERLRAAIEKETTLPKNSCLRRITVSLGVSTYPSDAGEKDKLIFCADGALYEAKRAGKNTLRTYERPPAGEAATKP